MQKTGWIILLLGVGIAGIFFFKKNIPATNISSESLAPQNDTIDLPDTIDWKKLGIQLLPSSLPYQKVCQKINQQKSSSKNLKEFFEASLLNKIIPYWYGTPWDFNGHTNVPQQGEIACGYFVSTTLRHLGLNVNRYHLAQQFPIHEAQSLSLGNALLEIVGESFEVCLKKIKTQLPEGIHFVGLDASHVGFLLKRKGKIFFIHSNYSTPAEVVIEAVEQSDVFQSFSKFYIAELSTNQMFLDHWAKGKKIEVIKE